MYPYNTAKHSLTLQILVFVLFCLLWDKLNLLTLGYYILNINLTEHKSLLWFNGDKSLKSQSLKKGVIKYDWLVFYWFSLRPYSQTSFLKISTIINCLFQIIKIKHIIII